MTGLLIFVLAIHFILLLLLCCFGMHRLSMVFRWLAVRNKQWQSSKIFTDLPKVTIQVPLYNERFVAKRVIDAAVALEYPKQHLQIQIVDDSTDETRDIIAQQVNYHRQRGVNIEHVHRINRTGFKAGGLDAATNFAEGEFIAIFDADFVPNPNWLIQCINYFTQQDIGMVQTRWQHINKEDSELTRIQTMALDSHFGLEQQVRSHSNMLLNFNGTAGIWRKTAIKESGGWRADTLTEDLDLSYRAQLIGWRMLYVHQVGCMGELPATMNDFKSQQHRWAKGAIEVMKKLLLSVWESPFTLKQKVEASFHLANNLAYLVMVIDTLFLMLPSILIRYYLNLEYSLWIDFTLAIIATSGHLAYLLAGQAAVGLSVINALIKIPRLLLLGIQLSVNNSIAALEAMLGMKSPFIRTPKRGDADVKNENNQKQWYNVKAPKSSYIELLLGLCFSLSIIPMLSFEMWLGMPFILLLVIGYLSTAMMSLSNQ